MRRRNVVLPFTVTKSVTILEMSKAVASRDTNLVFGEFSRRRGSGFNLCPLIADDTVKDLILPRKRLENGLGSTTMLISVGTRDL